MITTEKNLSKLFNKFIFEPKKMFSESSNIFLLLIFYLLPLEVGRRKMFHHKRFRGRRRTVCDMECAHSFYAEAMEQQVNLLWHHNREIKLLISWIIVNPVADWKLFLNALECKNNVWFV